MKKILMVLILMTIICFANFVILHANEKDEVLEILQTKLIEIQSKSTRVSNEYILNFEKLIRDYEIASINNDESNPAFWCGLASAYFILNNEELFNELLNKFYNNQILNMTYSPNPLNYAYIYNVNKFYTLAYETSMFGSSAFENFDHPDLYHSIHGFSYERGEDKCYQIIIHDRYDFAANDANNYTSENIMGYLMSVIINKLYEFQENGTLLPYYVYMDPAYGGTHNFECSNYDNVAHTIICTTCNYSMVKAHDLYQVGNMMYCNDCDYSGRYGLVGPELKNLVN